MRRRKQVKKPTDDALVILDRITGRNRKLRRGIEAARLELELAELIYQARTASRITQTELARLVGTTQSVISRLEDADYQGHSLTMLQRIAAALNRKLDVRFVRVAPRQRAS